MSLDKLFKSIPDEVAPDQRWTLSIDGEKLSLPPAQLCLSSPFGTLLYGLGPAGYPTWSFQEVGSGGSVVIPYLLEERELFIGVVEQYRPNQGGVVFNLVRGFVEPGKDHIETARAELAEETGLINWDQRLVALDGPGLNPNSTFFVTLGAEAGVRYFALRVFPEEIEGQGPRRRFKTGLQRPLKHQLEQIYGAVFLPWTEAATLQDGYTAAGVARLLAYLCTGKHK